MWHALGSRESTLGPKGDLSPSLTMKAKRQRRARWLWLPPLGG